MDTLVTAEWLLDHLDDPDLVVIDCDVEVQFDSTGFQMNPGQAAYERGHIPGAVFADLFALCDKSNPMHFAMPTPEHFCAAMGALGVGDDSRVVLYAGMTAWAARVWWMLRWVGFDRAALLDGGKPAWLAAGLPLSQQAATPAPKTLTPRLRPDVIADQAEVRAALEDPSVLVIDTLTPEHYRGEGPSLYARPGHIPGAVNRPEPDLQDETGRYKPLEDLARIHDSDPNARTITYCGGGIMASSSAFVLTRLGFTDVAVYAASLQEWAANPDNPVATGA